MLTNLDFLKPGSAWPPPTEFKRLELYSTNKQLFEGDHASVFSDWLKLISEGQREPYLIVLNWPKRQTLLFADLLLGEAPRITAGPVGSDEQKTLERILVNNQLLNTAYEVAIDVDRYGTGLFKVRFDNGRAVIEGQQPAVWFPVVAPNNVKDIQAHVLAWAYEENTMESTGLVETKTYLQVEVHFKGRIESRKYLIVNGSLSEPIEQNEISTGVNEFLIVPVNNVVTTDRVTGLDGYSDIKGILRELENRIAQIGRILNKHADPNLYGPDTILEEDPATGQLTYQGGGKYFPVAADQHPPGYVTWDGQLEAAYKQLDWLMSQLYALSETSAAAFGQLQAGLAESGTALRRLLMAPLARVNRMRLHFDPALKQALRLASLLERAQGVSGVVELTDIHIDWQDGLPDDDVELTQNEAQRYAAGLTSLESALRRLYNLEGEALQEEINRIRQEQAHGAAELPSIQLPPFEEESQGEI